MPGIENLRQWTKRKRRKQPKNHIDDCYFCLVHTSDYSKKNKQNITYPSFDSDIRPLPHSDDVPMPVFIVLLSIDDGSMSEII